jgi:hypothetical protein
MWLDIIMSRLQLHRIMEWIHLGWQRNYTFRILCTWEMTSEHYITTQELETRQEHTYSILWSIMIAYQR